MNKNPATIKFVKIIAVLIFCSCLQKSAFAKEVPYTLEDRDRLTRVEIKLEGMSDRLTRVETKLEGIEESIKLLREEMKTVREEIKTVREEMNKRFEFQQQIGIGVVICFVGLLLWDRRTFKEKAKEEAITVIETGKVKDILGALREIARTENTVAEALRKFNLL